ncbi:hypothetical protein DL95DRAFT_473290 [Leptodontidium sp. 2 PMI_412]|nr:hypothetical protein DL95DRAFT_473290 [Leptodontidium sp. 2 PMI_412]
MAVVIPYSYPLPDPATHRQNPSHALGWLRRPPSLGNNAKTNNNNNDQNIVSDAHNYFPSQGTYTYEVCNLAKPYQNATNPVFIGEWSIQASKFNTGDVKTRSLFYNSQLAAQMKFLQGRAFWNAKHFGNVVVGTDSTDQSFYWSWQKLVR